MVHVVHADSHPGDGTETIRRREDAPVERLQARDEAIDAAQVLDGLLLRQPSTEWIRPH
jgi:hypothetical protein